MFAWTVRLRMHTDHRNMPRDTLIVALLSEEAKSGRHVLIHPLLLRVRVSSVGILPSLRVTLELTRVTAWNLALSAVGSTWLTSPTETD